MRKTFISIYLALIIIIPFFIISNSYEIYSVSSISMENTLFEGDYLLVRKSTINKFKLKELRNKIILFSKIESDNSIYIKRCVAITGDTLEIKNDSVFINLRFLDNINKKYLYNIYELDREKSDISILAINPVLLNYSYLFDKGNCYESLCSWEVEMLTEKKKNIRIEYVKNSNLFINELYFKHENWNQSNFGPIVFTGSLQPIIKYSKELKDLNDSEKLNKECSVFVLGDNTFFSTDSRHFGGIPSSNILGITSIVLFSINNNRKGFNKVRWDRILKTLN